MVVSGDPGFYSLAKKVVARFGRHEVSIIPGISSIQIMAARLCRSWVGVVSTTIHGRARPPIAELERKLALASALVILLGRPEEAASLLEWIASNAELASAWAAIGWDLGLPEEKVLEFGSLSALTSDLYRGRLALLWLEKRDGARDV